MKQTLLAWCKAGPCTLSSIAYILFCSSQWHTQHFSPLGYSLFWKLVLHLISSLSPVAGMFFLMVFFWGASLVAQRLQRLLMMWETWVQPLGREDPLEKKWQPAPVFLPGESHGWRNLVGYSPQGCKELDMTERPLHFTSLHFTFWNLLAIFRTWLKMASPSLSLSCLHSGISSFLFWTSMVNLLLLSHCIYHFTVRVLFGK